MICVFISLSPPFLTSISLPFSDGRFIRYLNQYAIGQFVNHPPPETLPNVISGFPSLARVVLFAEPFFIVLFWWVFVWLVLLVVPSFCFFFLVFARLLSPSFCFFFLLHLILLPPDCSCPSFCFISFFFHSLHWCWLSLLSTSSHSSSSISTLRFSGRDGDHFYSASG